MPYRRLPNTDITRIRSLKTAIEKSYTSNFQEVAVSMKNLSDAHAILHRFERLCQRYQQAFDTQVKANIIFQSKAKNAKMYLSHFVQVLYMSIDRAEIKKEHLKYYDLHNHRGIVPDMLSNEQILRWGEEIINGENMRISLGGVPIYNPTIAKVKVMFSLFKEGFQNQQLHMKSTERIHQEVVGMRKEVDALILAIWDEVEKFHSGFSPEKRLNLNREYGLIYYYRKGEIVE